MIIGAVVQQPLDILDYDIHYDEWLGTDGPNKDSVVNVSINIIPDSGSLNVAFVISGGDTVKLWIQGGNTGEEYTVEVTAVTNAGRTKQDEMIVQIEDFV